MLTNQSWELTNTLKQGETALTIKLSAKKKLLATNSSFDFPWSDSSKNLTLAENYLIVRDLFGEMWKVGRDKQVH